MDNKSKNVINQLKNVVNYEQLLEIMTVVAEDIDNIEKVTAGNTYDTTDYEDYFPELLSDSESA